MLAKRRHNVAVMSFAFFPFRWNHQRVEPALASKFNPWRLRAIRNHDGDARIRNSARLDAIGNGNEVGTATRKQNADVFHDIIHHRRLSAQQNPQRLWVEELNRKVLDNRAPAAALTVYDFSLALHNAAHGIKFFAGSFQQGLRLLEFLCRHHHQHSNAHVECAQHFFLGHIAQVL